MSGQPLPRQERSPELVSGISQDIRNVSLQDSQAAVGIFYGPVNIGRSKNLNKVLNGLETAKDAPFNAYQRQHDTCLPDTRVDLLREIHDWADGNDSPGIFWLSGLAGTGKTTIAHTVAKEYHAKGRLAASFFFSRAGGDVSHAGKFITSIVVQLASSIPALKRSICDAILKDKDIVNQSLDNQWRELVLGPLSRLENKDGHSRYVLVVDALDECEDQNKVQLILQCLAEVQLLRGTQLRVLLTSRPEDPIRYEFTQVRQEEHRDFVLHDIKPAIVQHDITVFLRHQLGLVQQKCRLEASWPSEGAIGRLVQNSGGLFIWAATACRFIAEDGRLVETRLALLLHQGGSSTLPPERKLDEIYTTVLANSMRGEYSEAESQMLYKMFRQVVGPIVTMQDALSVASLASLLRKDVAMLRRTLANLHSVLDVPDANTSAVRLLHPSFRDFLLDPRRCSNPQFCISERIAHCELYKGCLQVMSKHLRRDICDLKDPGVSTASLSQDDVNRHIQPHVQYACRFWVYHCQRSDIDTGSCCDVETFFRKHFLHWLESLALLRRVSNAVDMIYALESMFLHNQEEHSRIRFELWDKITSGLLSILNLETHSTLVASQDVARASLQSIVHDATRFVLAFRPVLEEAPLQVYYAGLVFSPKSSVIRQIFSKEAPDWLSYMPEVLESWSACLQTLKGHSGGVTAVTFSPDGKTLASASWDKTVKLWDAGSGKALQTLKGHSSKVNAVAFSPDSKTLVSASDDGTVRLWDIDLGKALQVFKGHSNAVYTVAFSPYGKTLASASSDRTVRLWDIDSGKALQVFKGHSDAVYTVAFSPYGKTLASASSDRTVRLWDIDSGKALQVFKGHSDAVYTVAFSPYGKTLASASDDGTVKIWDAETGKALQTLRGHFDTICTVAFSPYGKTLASASSDRTIRLWDVGSGRALQTLKDHSSGIDAVAFSPDGKMLVSASNNGTVKMWDVGSGKALQTLKDHSSGIDAVAFSPDSKTLVSASDNGTVKVWDTRSGKALQTLKGHSDSVLAIAFSPDGKTLALASINKTMKLWDTDLGKALQTLKGHLSYVYTLAFSPDGKTLASASWDETVKLWDVGSGKALQTLNGHFSYVYTLAFSPDSKKLALALPDGMVELWDASSGNALQTLNGHSSEVNAVAFSPDGKTLASASDNEMVMVWDLGSGKALQTVMINSVVQKLWFNNAEGSLWSDKGLLLITGSVDNAASPLPPPMILLLSGEEWICWKGSRILWIPAEYRSSVFVVHGNTIGFGYSAGLVLILRFAS